MNISLQHQYYNSIQLNDCGEFPGSNKDFAYSLIFRHGESEFNVPNEKGIKRAQGQSPEVQLTEKGIEQAQALGNLLKGRVNKLDLFVISSSAVRATKTAAYVADILGLKSDPDFISDAFLELSSGPFEGCPKDDPAYKKAAEPYKKLSAKDKFASSKVVGGETLSNAVSRAKKQLSITTSQLEQNKTILLFAHAQLMNALVLSWTKMPLSEEEATPLPDVKFENCDGLIVRFPRSEEGRPAIEKGEVVMILRSGLHN